MIHYVSPWTEGNIGRGLNEAIARLPDEDWVCVRDGDTLFMEPDWGRQIAAIVEANRGQFDLISCMTNRLRASYQLHDGQISDEPDLNVHVGISRERRRVHGTHVEPTPLGPLAAMLLLFPKSLWAAHPFEERTIYFDQLFCAEARARGARLGVAWGLYVLHLYRWGHKNPAAYTGHLA